MIAPEMVTRTLTGWRTEDGKAFTDALEAWDHEVTLSRAQVLETCRDHVQAGAADALSVCTALLEAPGVFAMVLERAHVAASSRALAALSRRLPGAPKPRMGFETTPR